MKNSPPHHASVLSVNIRSAFAALIVELSTCAISLAGDGVLYYSRGRCGLQFRLGWLDLHAIALTYNPNAVQVFDIVVLLKGNIGMLVRVLGMRRNEFNKCGVFSICTLDEQLFGINASLHDPVRCCRHLRVPHVEGECSFEIYTIVDLGQCGKCRSQRKHRGGYSYFKKTFHKNLLDKIRTTTECAYSGESRLNAKEEIMNAVSLNARKFNQLLDRHPL